MLGFFFFFLLFFFCFCFVLFLDGINAKFSVGQPVLNQQSVKSLDLMILFCCSSHIEESQPNSPLQDIAIEVNADLELNIDNNILATVKILKIGTPKIITVIVLEI